MMDTRKDWQGKRIVIIGIARQGLALARYLVNQGAAVVLNDSRPAEALAAAQQDLANLETYHPGQLTWAAGGHPLELLDGADLVCPSGGVPLELPIIQEARRRGIPLSNDSQIFLEAAPCTVIGITGSAGKTTTTTLVGRMCGASGRRAWVGGNIGNPLVNHLDKMQPDDLAVVELSSFQLDLTTRSPQVAAVLNVTPNHLDRHGTMEAYAAAKANILRHQKPANTAVLGREDAGAWAMRGLVQGQLYSFGRDQLAAGQAGATLDGQDLVIQRGSQRTVVLHQDEILLRGEHNLMNVLAAAAICAAANLPGEVVRAGVRGFHGVPHRLEYVRTWRGADWYNDSIATAPERAMAALRAFEAPIVLLAGGRDKDLPWDDFARLVCQRVHCLVTFGEAAAMIATKVSTAQKNTSGPLESIHEAPNLEAALQTAANLARPGDVVLLAPGGTSFDEFTDFAERGERFKQWLQQQI